MTFAETSVPIQLNGQKYAMVFDANTMAAYEEVRPGKFFLETAVTMAEIAQKMKEEHNSRLFFRLLPIADVQALVWAAIHTYDENDEPTWPLKYNHVRRLITQTNIAEVLQLLVFGYSVNAPTAKTMGESPAAGTENSTTQTGSSTPSGETESNQENEASPETNGGISSGLVPVSAFD
jgi:hypothetical protein